MYIKAYSKPMAYSGIFRTVDILSHFQAHYSGVTQKQFIRIPRLILADLRVFGTIAYLDE